MTANRLLPALAALLLTSTAPAFAAPVFNRIASFPVAQNNADAEATSAEIIVASEDGTMRLGNTAAADFLRNSFGHASVRCCEGQMEAIMADKLHTPIVNKPQHDGSDKPPSPKHEGGSAVQNAREWGGGTKASKGPITAKDKHNQNSSAKS